MRNRFAWGGAVLALATLLTAPAVQAETSEDDSSGIGVGVRASTLGLGLDFSIPLAEQVGLRFNLNSYEDSYYKIYDGIEYASKDNLTSFGALIDWHLFNNPFRVTVGLYHNNNKTKGAVLPSDGSGYQLGGTTYTAIETGSLKYAVEYDKIVPYVGVGLGARPFNTQRLTMHLDLGILYLAGGKVEMGSDGTLAGDPAFRADLEKHRRTIQRKVDDDQFYPVFSVGAVYRF